MPFVLCEACGHQVVVDPGGICPEGHRTGVLSGRVSLGAGRVAAAIGHGFDAADPEEPQPWVGRIEPPEIDLDADVEAAADATVRSIRPLGVPQMGTERRPMTDDPPPLESADRDALLQELHSLSGLGLGDDEPPARTARTADLRPVPSADAPRPPRETPPGPERPLSVVPDPDLRRQASAELAALEASLSELSELAGSGTSVGSDAGARQGGVTGSAAAESPRHEVPQPQPQPQSQPQPMPKPQLQPMPPTRGTDQPGTDLPGTTPDALGQEPSDGVEAAPVSGTGTAGMPMSFSARGGTKRRRFRR